MKQDLATSLTGMFNEWLEGAQKQSASGAQAAPFPVDLVRSRLARYINADGMAVILEDALRVEDGRIEGVGYAVCKIASAVETGNYIDH